MILQGIPCDRDNIAMPEGTPPPHESDNGPEDWTLYENWSQFEFVDYIYTKNQTSAGGIDQPLNIWATTLIRTNSKPPFLDHNDLYCTIDSTPVGDIMWELFKLKYNGDLPDDDIPTWMEAKHKV